MFIELTCYSCDEKSHKLSDSKCAQYSTYIKKHNKGEASSRKDKV